MLNSSNNDNYYYQKELNPKISFIIPVFNKMKFLSICIKSIQNQSFKEIELIIIDDHSADNSIKIIEKFKKVDRRIYLIKNRKNMGTLYSRYIGSINSKGSYFFLLILMIVYLKIS